jgi:two-component system CheB/CheR fusion protein
MKIPDPQTPAPLRVLVVDDNRDGADTLAMILRIYGYAIRVAYDGLAALEAADEFQPDVLVLDIGLPGLDGFTLAERLRGMPAFAHTTMIALTAYRGEEYRHRSKQAGFDHYLVKPAEVKQLRALFQECRQ